MNPFHKKSPIAIDQCLFTLDLAGNFRSVNQETERLTGYGGNELARMNVLDLLPGKTVSEVRAIAIQSVRQRCGTVFEIEITTRDRRQIMLEVSVDLARRADRSIEFRGIALLKDEPVGSRLRPRCLDVQFRFRSTLNVNAELHAAW